MPNKTIYVSEGDLPLFDRAQELAGGNLSAAISRALRRFVEVQEAHMQGIEEVTVTVGRPGARRRKRFMGTRVVRWRHAAGDDTVERFTVYRTKRGRYAVHVRRDPEWMGMVPGNVEIDIDLGGDFNVLGRDWTAGWASGEHTLNVYETLEELKDHVPPELGDLVEERLSTPDVEDLDI